MNGEMTTGKKQRNERITRMVELLQTREYRASEMAKALNMTRQNFETLLVTATYQVPELYEYTNLTSLKEIDNIILGVRKDEV